MHHPTFQRHQERPWTRTLDDLGELTIEAVHVPKRDPRRPRDRHEFGQVPPVVEEPIPEAIPTRIRLNDVPQQVP